LEQSRPSESPIRLAGRPGAVRKVYRERRPDAAGGNGAGRRHEVLSTRRREVQTSGAELAELRRQPRGNYRPGPRQEETKLRQSGRSQSPVQAFRIGSSRRHREGSRTGVERPLRRGTETERLSRADRRVELLGDLVRPLQERDAGSGGGPESICGLR